MQNLTALQTALYHELGHALFLRQKGQTITLFELERADEYFGEVKFQESKCERELMALELLVGPLAEVRFTGLNRKIDANRSLEFLANALAGPPNVAVYFENIEAPFKYSKAIFGTDWNGVGKLFDAAEAEIHGFDRATAIRELLTEAIKWVNDVENWTIIVAVANDLVARPEVATLAPKTKIDLAETVQTRLDQRIAEHSKTSPN